MEAIRGVNCDYAVQKLLEKDLVIISGRNEDAVGKPLIYATSKSFMDYFGINSAEELPKISEVFMEEMVKATEMSRIGEEGEPAEETEVAHEEHIVVGETGELHIITDEVPTHIHVEEHHEENKEKKQDEATDEDAS